jgi:phage-related tail fiber protein
MRVDIRKQGGYATSGISSSGGTVNGKLILSRHPSDATEAATKGYIDNLLSNLNANSFIQGALSPNRLPAFNGDVTNAEGSNIFSLYPTGVTPGKYTKVRVNTKGLVISGTSLGTTDIPEMSWNKIISKLVPEITSPLVLTRTLVYLPGVTPVGYKLKIFEPSAFVTSPLKAGNRFGDKAP